MIDYHIHTLFSDGQNNPEDYIEAARNKKIDEIGFSDHFCFKEPYWSMKFSDMDLRAEKIGSLKKNSKIPVKLGLEMDFTPGFEKSTEELLKKYLFDYVIGSVHLVNLFDYDNPAEFAKYTEPQIYQVYENYFHLVQKAAKSGLFDVMAHPDVVKRWGFPKLKKDISRLLEETAAVFKASGVCIEVNMSGIDNPCKEMYPSEEFLKMFFREEVPIIISSDAHRPEDIGRYFDQALKIVKAIGYKNIVQFDKRQRNFIKI